MGLKLIHLVKGGAKEDVARKQRQVRGNGTVKSGIPGLAAELLIGALMCTIYLCSMPLHLGSELS